MRLIGVLVAGLAIAASAAPAAAQVDVVGEWRVLPYTMPINPIHVSLLRTGKVLIIAGSENDVRVTTYRAAVWDPVAGTMALQTTPWDMFCNGMSHLADGRVLVTGGNRSYGPSYGIRTTVIFDPATERFIQVQDMARGRWYPTNTILSDGRTATFSGRIETSTTSNEAVELYDVMYGWSPEYRAPFNPPLYPWLHLLPNGKLFFSGMTPTSHVFDPATLTWRTGVAQYTYPGDRWAGSSVLLPLRPGNAYAPHVMVMGGHNPATPTAEIIDLSEPTPRWRAVPSMGSARIEMNAVLLPTGKVLALGGSVRRNDATTASLAAETFDPSTETWSPAGVVAYPRLYHSVALLLPDATVAVAGSNPSAGVWDRSIEIYRPPYLFTRDVAGNVVPARRPTIARAPATVGYGAAFSVETPDAANIASVAFLRPGANTHAFDMEQRMVALDFTATAGNLTVTAPPSATIAPPGHYMLFLVDRQGVPSVASFVHVSTDPTNQAPQGRITSPAADITVPAGTTVQFAGDGTDSDGSVAGYSWVFPGGEPGTADVAVPGAVLFRTPGTYTVSLTVADNRGRNDPSPPTRTVTVTPATAPATVSITALNATAHESGATPATVQVTRSGSTATALTVRYTVGGTATPGADYVALPGTVTIPPGAASATFSVVPVNDTLVEGDETVTISLAADGAYAIGAPAATTVTIVSDDTVATGKDLVIRDLRLSAASVAAGAGVRVSYNVVNLGTTLVSETYTDRMYLSTTPALDGTAVLLGTSHAHTADLAAGARHAGSQVVTIAATTVPGPYYLLVQADALGVVSEVDETNNVTAVPLTVLAPAPPLPSGKDLVIEALQLSAGSVAAGQSVTLGYRVANRGTAVVTETYTEGFYLSTTATLDGAPLTLGTSAGHTADLAPGATLSFSRALTIPATTPTGSYYLLVMADVLGVVAEGNESNNVSAVPVLVTSAGSSGKDLVIEAASVSPATVPAGGSVTVSYNVANRGTSTVTEIFNERIYLSTNATFETTDPARATSPGHTTDLAPGATLAASITLTIPSTTAAGSYYLLIRADVYGTVAETNESNNVVAVPITVTR